MENLHNISAEQELLGAMISSSHAIHEAKDIIKPEHLVGHGHLMALEAIYSLSIDGCTITPSTLSSRLPVGVFGVIETTTYLMNCMNASISVISPKDYAYMLADLFVKRSIVDTCHKTIHIAASSPMDSGIEIAAKCASNMRDFVVSNGKQSFQSDKQISLDVINGLFEDLPCYSTGISQLDDAMDGGLYASRVYGIFARMKMGKTILAGTLAYNLMQNKHKTLFIAGEMSARQIHERILSRMMECYSSDFRNKESRQSRWFQEKLSHATSQMNGYLQYADAAGITFSRLKDITAEAKEKHDCKVIILDYWQLVQSNDYKISKAEHLSKVAQWIAESSKKDELAWVVVGQLNRDGKIKDSDGAGAAFDQIYNIMGNPDDRHSTDRWLEMAETRYTKWQNVGSEENPAFYINEKGLFFNEYER
jgi:replicative DNA helicase